MKKKKTRIQNYIKHFEKKVCVLQEKDRKQKHMCIYNEDLGVTGDLWVILFPFKKYILYLPIFCYMNSILKGRRRRKRWGRGTGGRGEGRGGNRGEGRGERGGEGDHGMITSFHRPQRLPSQPVEEEGAAAPCCTLSSL